MRRDLTAIAGIVLVTSLASFAHAEVAGVQFSAEMISRGPDGQTTTGRMFVGDGRVRMEMSQQGREIVRISDEKRRMEWILFPDQQTYLERGAPPGEAPVARPAPSAETDPCAGMPGFSCRRAGEELVAGRPAVKWEMQMTHEGQTLQGAQWIDTERGLPLKHLMPNGDTMELALIGTETLDGRTVEKWEMTTTSAKQPPSRSLQWFDPELKLSVREEFPGGFVRELKSISVGEQPDHLFTVPAGYSRTEMPAPAQ
ncbi:MAG: hypothetical protein EOM91_07390 [Sphingobacteriia bacterium]|nr:hypothetical protein [Sphingobacteriia bacterium]NCC39401.1 hypothetical protein [Gammaproteobacteria bacterium]